jgi:plasmid segregation protein ParM
MTMKWYPYGHDFGNSQVCGVLIKGGQQLKRSEATAFVDVDLDRIKNVGNTQGNESEDLPDPASRLAIQLDGEPFTVAFGDLAIAQGVPTWNGRGDEDRYASHYSVRAILALSSQMITDKEYGLYVVCGLPADLFMEKPELRKQIKQKIEGKAPYTFSMDGGKTWRKCAIEVANVIMEGAGALRAYANSEGQTLRSDAEAAVIDVGGGTTDLYAQHGPAPLPDVCQSARIAVETVTKKLMTAFEKKYHRPLVQYETRAMLYAYVSSGKKKPYPRLSAFGQDVSAEEQEALLKPIVSKVGSDIASFVMASLSEHGGLGRFKPIVLIGGGFYYFAEILKKKIPHLEFAADPALANALGYATLSARLWRKSGKAAKSEPQDLVVETTAEIVGTNHAEK